MILVGPHPADHEVWQDMARQVIKRRETMRYW